MPLPCFPASAVVLDPNENVFDPELDKPVLGAAGVAVGLSNCVGVPKPKLNEPGVADVPAVEDPVGVEIPKVELCWFVGALGVVVPNPKLFVDVPLGKLKEDTVSPNPKLPAEPVLGAPGVGV